MNRRVGANPTPGSDTGMPTIADCRIRKHDGFSRSKSRKRSRFRFKAPPVRWYLSKTEFHRPAGFPIYDFAVTRQLIGRTATVKRSSTVNAIIEQSRFYWLSKAILRLNPATDVDLQSSGFVAVRQLSRGRATCDFGRILRRTYATFKRLI